MRLIDADALKKGVNGRSTHWLNDWSTLGVLAIIDEQPTIDAVPVKWIEDYMMWLRKREIQFAPVAIETMLSYYKDSQPYCGSCGERKDGEG